MNEKGKFAWVGLLPVFIAAIALIVSIRSCSISKESITQAERSISIAEKALDQSKKSLILEHRPYLILQPIREKDTDFFIEVMLGEKDITLKGAFEILNAGNSPAKNIRTRGIVVKSRNIKLSEDLQSSIKYLPVISLGPGEKRNMGFNVRIGFKSFNTNGPKREAPVVAVAETIKFRVTIPLTYSSDLDDTKDFRTTVTYEFPSFKEAYLIESIYE